MSIPTLNTSFFLGGLALVLGGAACAHDANSGPAASSQAAAGSNDQAGVSEERTTAAGPSAPALLALLEQKDDALPQEKHADLLRLARSQTCPCPGSKNTLAQCALQPTPCPRAPYAVGAILRGLKDGDSYEAISARLLERFGPRDPETIALDQAACRGEADAPVTMVVFSDFQCPFCSMASQLVEAVAREAGDTLRVCFKHYPLTRIHPFAQLAAQAAVAAQRQGKFWPMHDRLFENQEDLDADALVDHAKEVGLDLEQFNEDLDAPKTKAQIALDVAEAKRLQVRGTPTFYINGREMTDGKTVPLFMDWIEEAAALAR